MTRDELQRRILEAVGDDPDHPVFFSSNQLNRLTDEANEILAEDTRAIRRTALVPLKAGIGFVYIPAIAPDFMAPMRVWNHVSGLRLPTLSMAELDQLFIRWQDTTGTPELWFPVSWDLLGVYPRPAAAGGVLRIDYIAWPRSLMDGADRTELPEATHDALVLYGQYQGVLKKWDSIVADIPLQALTKHKAIANGRSGISRISVRSFQRPQRTGGDKFPSSWDSGR